MPAFKAFKTRSIQLPEMIDQRSVLEVCSSDLQFKFNDCPQRFVNAKFSYFGIKEIISYMHEY